ncbi:hypothetical protein MtrunA17_Chr4g0046601 [Medicago truncatula]|uniref:Protein E6 n=1 Tax=Medicago truncatula TaxID=3880 RepID=I3T3J6_MEDTR|nr:protein E6 [Medicago truncatula]AFK47088.1 unknown [Medicago truncatula]KEH30990.1 hypothetical protein MTR_4g088385 [Medicago truncatula]RHN62362.1 hypothetical protein MtrunA17_Chr4g0046601 [Medicago truncatula]
MAPISKFLSFLFLTALSFSLQIHARDSQFFSKVTHVNNNNNVREVPNNETPLNKPENQPVFVPETENSYGLYGHDTGLHPPTTTNTNNVDPNTYQSYEKTSSHDEINNNKVNNYFNYQQDSDNKYPNEVSDTKLTPTSYSSSSNNNYDNNKYSSSSDDFSNKKFPEEGYNSNENQNNNNNDNKYFYNNNNKDSSSNTKFTEEGYNSMENRNNNNNKYFYNNNNKDSSSNTKFPEEGYNSMQNQNNNNYEKYNYNNKVAVNDKYSFKSNNNYNNGERQGMSDTRVMEGGKYFYDVNSEEKYNPTFNGDSSKGVVNSENWYNKKGYFGNNNVNNYENNKNSMNGYQNQEQFEDDQEEFEP